MSVVSPKSPRRRRRHRERRTPFNPLVIYGIVIIAIVVGLLIWWLVSATGGHKKPVSISPVASTSISASQPGTLTMTPVMPVSTPTLPITTPSPTQTSPTPVVTTPGAHTPIRYVVQPGDYLIKIANQFTIMGGYMPLYQWNQTAIGQNPDLIHPGLVLVVIL